MTSPDPKLVQFLAEEIVEQVLSSKNRREATTAAGAVLRRRLPEIRTPAGWIDHQDFLMRGFS